MTKTLFFLSLALAAAAPHAQPRGYMAAQVSAITSVNPETGAQTGLVPSTSGVSALTFSSDGKTAFGAGNNNISKIDVATHRITKVLPANAVQSLQLSRDNTTLFAYKLDTSLDIFDVATGATLKRYPANTKNAFGTSVLLSPDGNTIWLLAIYNQYIPYNPVFITLTAVDAHALTLLRQLVFKGIAGSQFAIASDNTTAYLASTAMLQLDLTNGSVVNTFAFPAAYVLNDGSTLIVASGSAVLEISTSTQQILGQVSLPFSPGGMSLSPGQQTLYAYLTPNYSPGASTIQPVNVATLALGTPFTLPYPASAVDVNPLDGSIWSTSNSPALVASFNGANGGLLEYAESVAGISGVAPTRNGSKVYAFSANGNTIEVADGKTLKPRKSIPVTTPQFSSPPNTWAASPDGSRVYVLDNGIQAIDTATDTIFTGVADAQGTNALAVSADSKTLYAATFQASDGIMLSYDATTLKIANSNGGFAQSFVSLMVAPDGSQLYALGADAQGVSSLYVLDPNTMFPKANAPALGNQGVLSGDGKTIYVLAILGSPIPTGMEIQAIDTTSLQTTRTYPITLPAGVVSPSGYLALTPGGSELYVSSHTGNTRVPLLSINLGTGVQNNARTYFSGPIAFSQ